MLGDISEGKAYWCWLSEPDISSVPQWSLRLIPSEFEQEYFKTCGYPIQIEKDNDKDLGISVLINRKVKNMDDVLKKPILLDKDKKPLELIEELPNGSNVKVKYKCWTYTHPYTGEVRKGCDLIAVMVLDDIPSIF